MINLYHLIYNGIHAVIEITACKSDPVKVQVILMHG